MPLKRLSARAITSQTGGRSPPLNSTLAPLSEDHARPPPLGLCTITWTLGIGLPCSSSTRTAGSRRVLADNRRVTGFATTSICGMSPVSGMVKFKWPRKSDCDAEGLSDLTANNSAQYFPGGIGSVVNPPFEVIGRTANEVARRDGFPSRPGSSSGPQYERRGVSCRKSTSSRPRTRPVSGRPSLRSNRIELRWLERIVTSCRSVMTIRRRIAARRSEFDPLDAKTCRRQMLE